MTPTVSVLICTRNRAEELPLALASVLANPANPLYEVVIVDQSDDDLTQKVVETYRQTAPEGVALRHIPTDTRGLSHARNIAIAESCAELLAFTDDDCIVPSDWVATVASLFADDETLDLVYGQVLMPDEYEGRTDIVVPCLVFDTRRVLEKGDIFGMGANMAFRKRLITAIGDYDTVLGAGGRFGGGEDFDFTYRAQLANRVVVAEPRLRAVHKSFRTVDKWSQVTYAYGRGDAAFYGKHARCGDSWAAGVIRQRIASVFTKNVAKTLLGRAADWSYLRGFREGLKDAQAFPVDAAKRLYQPEPEAKP